MRKPCTHLKNVAGCFYCDIAKAVPRPTYADLRAEKEAAESSLATLRDAVREYFDARSSETAGLWIPVKGGKATEDYRLAEAKLRALVDPQGET